MNHISDIPKDGFVLPQIESDLRRIAEEAEVSLDQAFLRLCVNYLGFETDEELLKDGKDDCGFDFLDHSPSGATVIQAKSVEFVDKIDPDALAGPSLLTDLPRIRNALANLDDLPPKMNAKLKRSLMDLKNTLLSSSTLAKEDLAQSTKSDPFVITVYFCFLGRSFTPSAEAEFAKLDQSSFAYGSRQVQISYIPVFIPDLIHEKWKESNTKWINKKGEKREIFDLEICGPAIRDAKSAVFFTKASDLIEAYREIGYQIFESNVRCELKNSPVNRAIKQSILTHRGRNEFKHLNNGVTILCENFQPVGPKVSPTSFRLTKPGIINGLQTVKTLADSISELKSSDKSHFDLACEVLVRLHMQNSVADFRALVKSTNNQNPMKPRNLRSNEAEQIQFERLFAKFGWFYERKEGAWSAFSSDPRRWSTLPNSRPQDFKKGKVIKKVDNEEIAQAWLSFIGFSEQAIDQKRYLFQHDSIYDLVFKGRTQKHGAAYNFKIGNEDFLNGIESIPPAANGLLAAYLIREFAQQMAKSRKESRAEAIERLNLAKKTKTEQDQELSQDHDFLRAIIVRGMLLLFVEFVGHALYQAFGADVHSKFDKLLKNNSFAYAAVHGEFTSIKYAYEAQEYAPDDILIVLWEFYGHCLRQMLATGWLGNWQQAPNRSKFIYGESTRKPLLAEINSAEQLFKKGYIQKVWTLKINEAGGVPAFLRKCLA